jgi:hypothetical protein
MAQLAGPVLDPTTAVGTGEYIAAAPRMELGAVFVPIPASRFFEYEFEAPLVEPAFGASSELAEKRLVLATQQLSWEFLTAALLVAAWTGQFTVASLANALERETAHLSVVRRAARNPIFGRLAQLGPAATIVALQRLSGHNRPLWLVFLQTTAGARPARGAASIDDAVRAWREWGKRQGLV